MKQKIYSILPGLIFGVLVICFLIGFSVLAWTEPQLAPPQGNVPAPINVGSTEQWKDGRLGVGGGTPPEAKYWLTDVGNSLYFQNRNTCANPDDTNCTKMVIGMDGNVGIGTTGPGTKLHVRGSPTGATPISNTYLTVENNGAAHLSILGADANYGAVVFGSASDNNIGSLNYYYNSGTPYASIFVDGNENVRILKNGNVGIGTSPGYKLDVNGDINLPVTGFLRIAGNAGSSGQVLTRTSTGMAWQTPATATGFGNWDNTKVEGVVYQATTDGFVVAYAYSTGVGMPTDVRGYTGSNWADVNSNNVSVRRMFTSESSNAPSVTGFTMPVRKGDYWKVSIWPGNVSTVYWIPLGS